MKKILALIVVLSSILAPIQTVDAAVITWSKPVVTTTTTCNSNYYSNAANYNANYYNSILDKIYDSYGKNNTKVTKESGTIIRTGKTICSNPVKVVVPSKPTKPEKPNNQDTDTTPPANSADDSDFSAMQNEMLGYINAERAKVNAKALVLDEKLCEGAYLKSKDMAVNNYFDHTSPTYGSPFEMMNSLGISYRAAGENIAKNVSVKGAHDAFMNSAGHKANILNTSFGKVGLGFYQEGNYLYVTQWFTN